MSRGKIRNIGVDEETLEKARGEIHYSCKPHDWQMFEILVTFCKDHPNEFVGWKSNNLENLRKQWSKKTKSGK